ncbi:MAG: phosphate ABC transporter permease subunit PstC [Oscillospiraceae bacterium]|jgi:phosphate transport system permease protein|nr:phosphate ABC transporter permease subunit PstC [Oscillospiraceae bacterium]
MVKRWLNKEALMRWTFFVSACICIIAVALICLFLFVNGIPGIAKIGVFRFLTGTEWKPSAGVYGIAPMILGSLYVTACAIAFGAVVGILTAVFLARFCPKRIYKLLSAAVSLMAGIPSIVYGFFGLVVLVPLTQRLFGGSGNSLFTASLLLGVMILPTIISVSEAAIHAVPESYYEGAVALGATHERAVLAAVLPDAKSGIMAGVILGVGRAVGETMAVIMVAGNQAVVPSGLFKGLRTMTANIVLEMGYAEGLHREALIATAVVLFVFILLINILFSLSRRRVPQ